MLSFYHFLGSNR